MSNLLRAPALLLLALLSCHAAPPSAGCWQLLESGSSASLRGLSVVDRDVVWATGSGGTVLRSVDGGRSFRRCVLPGETGNEIRDVHAFGADLAFVMACQPARVYRTEDGGRSFDKVLDAGDPAAFFDGLSFFDRARAVVFGDPVDGVFMVFTSADGGSTWQRVPADRLPPALPGEGGFAASGTCLTVDDRGHAWIGTGIGAARVLRSADEGRSWQVATTPLRAGPASGIFSLAFRHGRYGVAVGGDYRPGARSVTTGAVSVDAGGSWRSPLIPPRGFRSCVAWVPGRRDALLAVGPTGTDLSRSGGRHWQALSEVGFHVVAFGADGAGFAAGSGGRIARLVFAGF